MKEDSIKQFASLFSGLDRAYGTYNLRNVKTKLRQGTKIVGKPATIHGPVTLNLFRDHLEGREGLGIVPIDDDSKCVFGAIDIDDYTIHDYSKIVKIIREQFLPLVACRSKSGGIHCFCFVRESVPASLMKEKLTTFASILGHGGCEIYPKQSQILSDRGDIGQWINLPYFNAEYTERYAFRLDGKGLSLNDFLIEAKKKMLSPKELEAFTVTLTEAVDDGPPCLQYLLTKGFSPGTRNDGLFNLAIYLKKKYPDDWEVQLDDYNIRHMDPPLSTQEVQVVVKSLKKREYNFTCDKSPIRPYCNLSECRQRKFGVGALPGLLQLTGLTKFNSQPPLWFVDVDNHGRLELVTEDLQSQSRFQRKCMEGLNQMPPAMPGSAWQKLIQQLLASVTIIDVPLNSSPQGMMFEYLEMFCTSRVQARSMDEILLGKPWSNDTNHYFRISDFMQFLERHRFRDLKLNRICALIKEHGGEHEFLKLKGKGVNVWKIPLFAQQTEKFDPPDIQDKNVM